ncbi:MAG: DUF5690 family protein [Planctomycetota bacterium]
MTYAVTAAFVVYFCMYAFRKPFSAATFDGGYDLGDGRVFAFKTLFVVSQLVGYALSKYAGIRVCSEARRSQRLPLLLGLIVVAELALVGFGAAPSSQPLLKPLAIFANGLPLGMVWGLVVLYLEGRRTSEILLTGLSCSYIVASGVVKDVGRALLAGAWIPVPLLPAEQGWAIPNPLPPVPEFWMPAATGALFLVPFALAAWLLDQTPEPDREDEAARTPRGPMLRAERYAFLRQYGLAIGLAIAAYFLLTAFRDYRDNYMVEVLTQLSYDYENNRSMITRSELLVAFGVMAVLSQLHRIRDNRAGLIATYAVMSVGLLSVGLATLLLDLGVLTGFWWITAVGMGAYLAYVPFGSVLFDRSIAQTRFAGTAVFGIYLADAVGYTGSVAIQLTKDLGTAGVSQLDFLRMLAYAVGLLGSALLVGSCYAFARR